MDACPTIVFIPKRQTGKSYIVRDLLEFTEKNWVPEYFICDIERKILGRIYNTFKVINPYEDDFNISITIPNFYDDNFNF